MAKNNAQGTEELFSRARTLDTNAEHCYISAAAPTVYIIKISVKQHTDIDITFITYALLHIRIMLFNLYVLYDVIYTDQPQQ